MGRASDQFSPAYEPVEGAAQVPPRRGIGKSVSAYFNRYLSKELRVLTRLSDDQAGRFGSTALLVSDLLVDPHYFRAPRSEHRQLRA